jgi:hypothetical protein
VCATTGAANGDFLHFVGGFQSAKICEISEFILFARYTVCRPRTQSRQIEAVKSLLTNILLVRTPPGCIYRRIPQYIKGTDPKLLLPLMLVLVHIRPNTLPGMGIGLQCLNIVSID